jgi:predicted Rossmann fold nucleotide-binding protein DprA/Smf involved in DNA uptake
MLRVIVAGSRSFSDFGLLSERLDFYLQRHCGVEIVSGTARGADRLGERYAAERGLAVARFPAQWDKYGRSAGFRRNDLMAGYATHAVIFWDGVSSGTGHMIQLARHYGLVVRVVRF